MIKKVYCRSSVPKVKIFWKYVDFLDYHSQGLKNDADFLYNSQFGVLNRSAEFLFRQPYLCRKNV